MELVQFIPELHYEMVSQWWRAYRIKPAPLDSLPTLGLLVEELAAVFLYQTDSSVAWIENLISNPKKPVFERSEAINFLIDSAAELAGDLGFKTLLGFTKRESVRKRVTQLQFMVHPDQYQMVSRRL